MVTATVCMEGKRVIVKAWWFAVQYMEKSFSYLKTKFRQNYITVKSTDNTLKTIDISC